MIEAMKQALDALEKAVSTCFDRYAHEQVMSRPEHFINQTITALRTAIEQAEKPTATHITWNAEGVRTVNGVAEKQEPVAKVRVHMTGGNPGLHWSVTAVNSYDSLPPLADGTLLYTAAQPTQQEPYGYVSIGDLPVFQKETPEIGRWETVYTTPPAAQRQPLTDEQIVVVMRSLGWTGKAPSDINFARAIEAAHGITGEKK